MARLSAVPGMAMIVGPGLGGGLAHFGLGVPILVDGFVSLSSSVLVFLYLPESAAWLEQKKNEKLLKEEATNELTPLAEKRSALAPVAEEDPSSDKPQPVVSAVARDDQQHWTLTLMCLAQLFNGITFSTLVSMLAISLGAKLQFDALQVGYTFVGLALVMVVTSIWFTPFYTNRFGVSNTAVVGTLVTAAANVAFAFAETIPTVFLALSFSRIAQSLRGASFGTLVARTTTIANRGSTLAKVQLFLNTGRLIGPVLGGHLANYDARMAPWLVAGAASFISAAFLALAIAFHPAGGLVSDSKRGVTKRPPLPRGFTTLQGQTGPLRDEAPTPQDVTELGEWFADLLTSRNYQWVSRKDATREMIERLLPHLADGSHEHVEDLEKLMKHANLMDAEFHTRSGAHAALHHRG